MATGKQLEEKVGVGLVSTWTVVGQGGKWEVRWTESQI